MERITVFTPTYNRRKSLPRVFESLKRQTFRDFIWIIVDDGSTDDTKSLVVEFEKEADFKIIYIYQENAGKHSAINRALQETTSELFLIADSDDSFKANALEVFINTWESIPEGERNQYKGVIAKCYNAEDGTPIGSYPQHMFDSNDAGVRFKTYSGLPFTYEIRKGRNGQYTKELWIDRRENSKSLAWSSVLLALGNIKKVGEVVERPKALGDIRGVTYIYGMFYRFGLIDVPDEAKEKMKKAFGKSF